MGSGDSTPHTAEGMTVFSPDDVWADRYFARVEQELEQGESEDE